MRKLNTNKQKFALNQFLNHPIADDFQSEDINFGNDLLMINDTRLLAKIKNQKEADELADFLVEEALLNLPELKQLGNGLAAQERLLKSNERAFYLPSVAVSGGWDRTLKRWDVTTSNGLPIPNNMAAWNLGVGVSISYFTRRSTKKPIKKKNAIKYSANPRTNKQICANQLETKS